MATSPQRQRLQNVLQLPGYPPNNGPLINDRELQIQTPLFIANVSKLVHTARRCSLFLFCSASFPGSLSSASLGVRGALLDFKELENLYQTLILLQNDITMCHVLLWYPLPISHPLKR